MFGLGAGEVVIILVLALIFIGPKKLPELARSLGKSMREFQKAKDEMMNEINLDDTEKDSSKKKIDSPPDQIAPKDSDVSVQQEKVGEADKESN